ncbi:hypothetical protein [Cohnella terricola]|uniref:Uncharacterized protein n=1 Tax=Cohnella terricola TaxID=1289167 RepID=A0A559JQS3_9BACL|nr:hypothetical protein [Cohnella terricola]TVY02229.1 hypothetical protein FPZ45_07280 [Cohnella terricola]
MGNSVWIQARVLLLLPVLVLAACTLIVSCDIKGSSGEQTIAEGAKLEKAADGTATRQVKWIYMSPPIPSQTVNTAYADQNPELASRLLEWIDQAKNIDGQGLTPPLHERSMAIEIVYENRTIQEVRPAWNCTYVNTGAECRAVEGKVWISDSDGNETFADSEPLFEFVQNDYKSWMPGVTPFRFPELIRLNETFQIQGHGSLMEKMVATLSLKDEVVWKSAAVAVDHGDYEIMGILDSKKYPAGEYEINITGVPFEGFEDVIGSGSIGTYVIVTE